VQLFAKPTWLERNLSWSALASPFLTFAGRSMALVVFVTTLFLEPGYDGPDLCPLHRLTGMPCPGCGVTRGLVGLSHGDFSFALGANPFVLVLWPVLVALAVGVFVPKARWTSTLRWIESAEPWPSRVVRVLFLAFFGFGLLRLLYFVAAGTPFP
jgi:hypothetical protein